MNECNSLKRLLSKGVKFYSSIIAANLPLFIMLGFISLMFSNSGLFPNEEMALVSQSCYKYLLPTILAYYAGKKIGGESGAFTGTVCGLAISIFSAYTSFIASIFMGTLCGILCRFLKEKIKFDKFTGFEMISKNIFFGAVGVITVSLTYFVFAPIFSYIDLFFANLIEYLTDVKTLPITTSIIETLKVFSLNNSINHGFLIPAGVENATKFGKSVFFLLETNPGPGLGILLALYILNKDRRKYFASCMTVQAIGGIHEIYFPIILSNLKLLIALILGAISGNLVFYLLHAGARGAISPGSIITIFLMCSPSDWLAILLGIATSAVVSCISACLILEFDAHKSKEIESDDNTSERIETTSEPLFNLPDFGYVEDIVFVCDAGIGSSVMAASMFKKILIENGLGGISVSSSPVDEIPEDADLLICQKIISTKARDYNEYATIIEVENFMDSNMYKAIIEKIKNND
ncbi:PTS mannitol transporter subunit IICB [Peptacetobacter hiranonis]|uniref:PTS mannitol transporter subunit IICB n=1 Tax=Peptacetobacter hiranonis TaxID=89152 RepID=UPI00191726E4|nr:PTS mannitol transporter subunit IICB [Peptacetobacter hiranonis]QQQ85766.1 PTS mannitol transporter subunit IICB [Peptacetobacter hiranonis]